MKIKHKENCPKCENNDTVFSYEKSFYHDNCSHTKNEEHFSYYCRVCDYRWCRPLNKKGGR